MMPSRDKSSKLTKVSTNWVNLPANTTFERGEHNIIITYKEPFGPYNLALIFCLLLHWFLFYQGDSNILLLYVATPFGWLAIALTINVMLGYLKKTIIEINSHTITITVEPGLFSESKKFLVNDIKQIYVQGVSFFYKLKAITATRKEITLLRKIYKREIALFLEEEIEHFLGIVDRPLMYELQMDKILFPTAIWKIWCEFAGKNNLQFTSGKYLQSHSIFGEYRNYHVKLVAHYNDNNQHQTYMEMAVNSPSLTSDANSLVLVYEKESQQETEKRIEVVKTAPKKISSHKPKDLLKTLNPPKPLYGTIGIKEDGNVIFYEQDNLVEEIPYLEMLLTLLADLLDVYSHIINLEGKAVSFLRSIASKMVRLSPYNYKQPRYNHPLQMVAVNLLETIAAKTITLAQVPIPLLCKDCLRYYRADSGGISNKLLIHYGCRTCYEFRNFYAVKQVIAVLDEGMETKLAYHNQVLRVNWLQHQALFDFDTVEIIQANNEQIERFVVEVGNNPDSFWQIKPHKMVCYISNNNRISSTAENMLTQIFARLKRI